ncbi:MAG TPA: hypothetical protein GX507_00540, partial [Clostridia bacterium]|nr:hypothetical protein [Clostridia bacterium]
MAVARMKRVFILCHSSLRDDVIMRLQDAGVMQLEDASELYPDLTGEGEAGLGPVRKGAGHIEALVEGERDIGRAGEVGEVPARLGEDHRTLEKTLDELAFTIKYLGRYVNERKGLVETFVTKKAGISPEDYAFSVTQLDYKGLYKQCAADDAKLGELQSEASRLKEQKAALEGWVDLDCPLRDLRDTEKVRIVPCLLPKKDLRRLTSMLEGVRAVGAGVAGRAVAPEGAVPEGVVGKGVVGEGEKGAESEGVSGKSAAGEVTENPAALVEVVSEDDRNARVVVFYARGEGEARVSEILSECGVEKVSFGVIEGLVKDEIKSIEQRLSEIPAEEQEIRKRAESLLPQRVRLMALYDHLYERLRRMEVRGLLGRTEKTSLIQGWMKAKEVPELSKRLADLNGEIEVFAQDPSPEDNPPVVLENPWFLKPFEVVTLLYGNPKYGEIDPTPFLAPFFFVFFGFALSDAGYGILLMLISAWMIKKMDIPEGGKMLFRLLFLGGASTVVFGALMGGWFGNGLDILPPALGGVRDFLKRFAVVDPLANPIYVLGVSLGLGIVQIWVGIVLKLVSRLKAGEVFDTVMDEGSWLFFIPAVIVFALSSTLRLGPITPTVGKWLAIAGAIYVMVAAGRRQKVIFLKPFSAVMGLYGSIGYVG